MAQVKLFGNRRKKATSSVPTKKTKKAPKKNRGLRTWRSLLVLLAILECLYALCVYSDNAFIAKWRNIYIQTAMSTMNHQWLATAFIPNSVIQEVMGAQESAMLDAIGVESQWVKDEPDETVEPEEEAETPVVPTVEQPELDPDQADFYELFWELDRDSMSDYLEKNPQALANGWDQIYINEAGLDDDGTDIYTTMGEQVLALDAQNQVLLLRVTGSTYSGVLAVAKDPSRLTVENSAYLGSYGQVVGDIAEKHNGILSMTGSGFIDEEGQGTGGILAGYAMSNGVSYGTDHMGWSYKRIELREDNRMYIVDAQSYVDSDTRDAVEFTPALIIDGKTMVDESSAWTALNPRACIGQSEDEEILMLVIEGRLIDSLGVSVVDCAEILQRHNAMQAMNLDGGTSAIMWYDGEYVTRCSNTALPEGRTLPNAFVYAGVS